MSLELEGVPFFIVSSTQRGGQWIGVVRFGVGKVASRLQFMVHLRGYSGPGPTVADIQKAVEDKDAYRAALGQAVAAMRGGPGGISGRARVARVDELVPREPPQITSGSMLSLFAFVWFKKARLEGAKAEREHSDFVRAYGGVWTSRNSSEAWQPPDGFSLTPLPGAGRQAGPHAGLRDQRAGLLPPGASVKDRWERRSNRRRGPRRRDSSWKDTILSYVMASGIEQQLLSLPGLNKCITERVLRQANVVGCGSHSSGWQRRATISMALDIASAGPKVQAAQLEACQRVPLIALPTVDKSGRRVVLHLMHGDRLGDVSSRASCPTSHHPDLQLPSDISIDRRMWDDCLHASGLSDYACNLVWEDMQQNTYEDAVARTKSRGRDLYSLHIFSVHVAQPDSSQGEHEGPQDSRQPVQHWPLKMGGEVGDSPLPSDAKYKAVRDGVFGGTSMSDLLMGQAMGGVAYSKGELTVCVLITHPCDPSTTGSELHDGEFLRMMQLNCTVSANSMFELFRTASLVRQQKAAAGEGGDGDGDRGGDGLGGGSDDGDSGGEGGSEEQCGEMDDEEGEEMDDEGGVHNQELAQWVVDAWDELADQPADQPSSSSQGDTAQASQLKLVLSYVGLTVQGTMVRTRQHLGEARNGLARAIAFLSSSVELKKEIEDAAKELGG